MNLSIFQRLSLLLYRIYIYIKRGSKHKIIFFFCTRMDASEINSIAKRITQQWITMIQSRVSRPSNASSKAFLNQLEANGRVVFKYQDRDLLDKALEYIPLQRLYDEAEAILEQTEGSLEDVVIQRLLHWFKHEFFSWVNNAPCDYCSSTQTKSNGLTQPSQEDLRYGAHVVETYQCLSCHQITRFPRYNDPGKLLETRRGRCGEWANCFTLCCHAVGSEARIIYDTTDHVWTEVYSEHEQRWVHCDACEEAWDRPLLYSMGWNKKLSYCTAFSIDEAIDVTKRYTRNWPEVLKRRDKISELELSKLLDEITAKRQEGYDADRKQKLHARRLEEFIQLEQDSKKKIIKEDELTGRQSGSLAWRTSRGETGQVSLTENKMSLLN
ncbi:uncharacterized protein B0P05DRAFT_26758 [Gilbertella persicaria]|uniref:uncharacterized protein n=1 Tax=Gilbertella persicaria TaxID=101096 RepID=UPI002221000C|nr:uncharacterized protein B0P05DRAFT_26758 [Gilbertella persicaria]KAI8085906.1 hypothetical protein B0P05DRAFT_26758 [Gilbertella persicaria]